MLELFQSSECQQGSYNCSNWQGSKALWHRVAVAAVAAVAAVL
jgi:anti-sigma-K factor RskA